MISFADAFARIVSNNGQSLDTERVKLSLASGRYLAKSQTARIDVPGYDNSAMDGYAVRSNTISIGQSYRVSQRIAAGDVAMPLESNTVARIFTGAMVPEGADAIILQEDTVANADNHSVQFSEVPGQGQHIRLAGQDIKHGQVVVEQGQKLSAADIGLLASVGQSEVDCYQAVRVAFFSTGDELKEPGDALAPGQIYNSNRYFLAASIAELGAEPVDLGRCPDTARATRDMLIQASERADCIVTTGGMSVGEEDYVRSEAEKLGSINFWKLAMKPGKPVAFGEIQGSTFFGLPGNPVSSFVTFQLLVRPWLLKQMGSRSWRHQRLTAKAAFNRHNRSKRLDFLRGRVALHGNAGLQVSVFANQSSGVLSSVARSNVLVPIEPGQSVQSGDSCEVIVLSPFGLDLSAAT